MPRSLRSKASIIKEASMSSEADSYELDIKNGKIAQGKEGGVYGAQGRDGLIIKQFKKNKSINKIRKEYGYQERAAAAGISPAVHSLDAKNKRIVMERLDRHLVQLCEDQNGELTLDQQKQIVDLYKRLGELGIYHNDSNPLNFMEKEGRMYLIDFGFSKDISKAKGDMGPNPNMVSLWNVLKSSTQGLLSLKRVTVEPIWIIHSLNEYLELHRLSSPSPIPLSTEGQRKLKNVLEDDDEEEEGERENIYDEQGDDEEKDNCEEADENRVRKVNHPGRSCGRKVCSCFGTLWWVLKLMFLLTFGICVFLISLALVVGKDKPLHDSL